MIHPLVLSMSLNVRYPRRQPPIRKKESTLGIKFRVVLTQK